MGDMGDFWRDVKEARAKNRGKYGIECPRCIEIEPKRNPTILLPGQKCRYCGYRDKRVREKDESRSHQG